MTKIIVISSLSKVSELFVWGKMYIALQLTSILFSSHWLQADLRLPFKGQNLLLVVHDDKGRQSILHIKALRLWNSLPLQLILVTMEFLIKTFKHFSF